MHVTYAYLNSAYTYIYYVRVTPSNAVFIFRYILFPHWIHDSNSPLLMRHGDVWCKFVSISGMQVSGWRDPFVDRCQISQLQHTTSIQSWVAWNSILYITFVPEWIITSIELCNHDQLWWGGAATKATVSPDRTISGSYDCLWLGQGSADRQCLLRSRATVACGDRSLCVVALSRTIGEYRWQEPS